MRTDLSDLSIYEDGLLHINEYLAVRGLVLAGGVIGYKATVCSINPKG